MNEALLRDLLDQYLTGTISNQDKAELAQMIEQPEYREKLESMVQESFQSDEFLIGENSKVRERVMEFLQKNTQKETLVRFINKHLWWRLVAAAVLIIVIGGTAWLVFTNRDNNKNNVAVLSQQQRFKNDISPARQQAFLTLADGSNISLDSASNGILTLQGATKIIKKDGTISYVDNNATEVLYNTITTQKGNTFHLHMGDGTHVWLDALSSVRFPTSFPDAERVVEVTGQVYFEVAKNERQPFKVKTGNQFIEVLGTHFNINSYDPQNSQTTLLEGSVKVVTNHGSDSVFIKPGQQVRINNSGIIKLATHVDVEEIMAWKNGRFHFNTSSVEEIMDQLSRWYDIEVVYQDKITETFSAKISKELPVSKLLVLFEMTKQIKFTVEGKKVTVMNW